MKPWSSARCLVVEIALILAWSTTATAQTTLYVPTPLFPTIQSAINAASSGDTISVAPGTYNENLYLGTVPLIIEGAGPDLTTIDGGGILPCVEVVANGSSTIRGFSLINGRGTTVFGYPFFNGGGVKVVGSTGIPDVHLENCRISACAADNGGAVYSLYAWCELRDVEVTGCSAGVLQPLMSNLIGGGPSAYRIESCRIHGNSVTNSLISSAGDIRILDTRIESNTTAYAALLLHCSYAQVQRVVVAKTVVTNPLTYLVWVVASNLDVSDVQIVQNTIAGNLLLVIDDAGAGEDVTNLTLAQNTFASAPAYLMGMSPSGVSVVNSILWNNTDGVGAPPIGAVDHNYIPAIGRVHHSIVEGGTALDPTVQSADPLFVAPLLGDYRLSPGSPAIDAGTSSVSTLLNTGLPPIDGAGRPRLRGAAVDLGALESFEAAHDPAADGSVGLGQGGPYDLLLINGSSGNALREVAVPVGAPVQISLLQSPAALGPQAFSIFGLFDQAPMEFVTTVPFGIGDMSFPPAPMLPWLQPYLFTAASTLGPINGVPALTPATSSPWTAPPFAIPFPLDLSFQAVIEESPGIFAVTNLVVLRVP